MPKRITETKERWCCQWSDLIPAPDSKKNYRGDRGAYDKVVCKHCGQRFHYARFMDAAGSMDWTYEEDKE